MDEASLRQALQAISGKELALRKAWYSPVAEAYQARRPSYPSVLVGRAVSAAKLSSSSRVLELGCGPGTATVSFAALGCSMVCLEPNSDFCAMARENCKAYPTLQVINQSFEEWDLEPAAFDAVLAASSIHWIPAEIAYDKASRALKPDGHLILLWNKEPQPSAAIQAALSDVFRRHVPVLGHTEDRATQERILSGLGQTMLDSGKFHNLVAATLECSLTTTPDHYIDLLGTYSPYHKLDPRVRSAMFSELKQCLVQQGVGEIPLSYLSAVHIGQRIPSAGR